MSLKRKTNSGPNTRSILSAVMGGLLGGILGALSALVPVWFSAQPAGDTGTLLFFVAILATIFLRGWALRLAAIWVGASRDSGGEEHLC